jgi:hypothetical protein
MLENQYKYKIFSQQNKTYPIKELKEVMKNPGLKTIDNANDF